MGCLKSVYETIFFGMNLSKKYSQSLPVEECFWVYFPLENMLKSTPPHVMSVTYFKLLLDSDNALEAMFKFHTNSYGKGLFQILTLKGYNHIKEFLERFFVKLVLWQRLSQNFNLGSYLLKNRKLSAQFNKKYPKI